MKPNFKIIPEHIFYNNILNLVNMINKAWSERWRSDGSKYFESALKYVAEDLDRTKHLLNIYDEPEIFWYKDKPYQIVSETLIKIDEDWVEGVVYETLYRNRSKKGSIFVRSKQDFESKFKTEKGRYETLSDRHD